jgi:hypothetical protein
MVIAVGRAKPVILPSRAFETQGSAMAYFSAMLKRYKPGDRLTSHDSNDVEELLSRHPHVAEKIGVGIDHFEVQDAEFATQCFRVVRADGTWDSFSYQVCVAPERKWA